MTVTIRPKTPEDVIERLYAAATDANLAALDETLRAAGLMWQCLVCKEDNYWASATCDGCGRGRDGGGVMFSFQYRREQRAEFDVVALDLVGALELADRVVDGLELSGDDDSSDDPGELELLETEVLDLPHKEEAGLLQRARLRELEELLDSGGTEDSDLVDAVAALRKRCDAS